MLGVLRRDGGIAGDGEPRPAWDPFTALPPLFLRLGVGIPGLLLTLTAPPAAVPGWPFALLLILGMFTRLNAFLTLLFAVRAALLPPVSIVHLLAVFGIASFMRRLRTQGPGPLAIDPLPFDRWLAHARLEPLRALGRKAAARYGRRRRAYYESFASFSLRLPLALAMMPVGLWFVLRGEAWVPSLGWAWIAAGSLLALGFLTPWTAAACAGLFLLGLAVTGSPLWIGLAFGCAALAFIEDDRVSLDRILARRSRRFAALRLHVPLEPVSPGAATDRSSGTRRVPPPPSGPSRR